MNWAHIHLIINHFPVTGFIFGFLFLLYATIRKSEELKKTGLGFLVIMALITVPVYFTGNAAGEIIERLPGASKSLIGTHQEVASLALTVVVVFGLFAAGGLFYFRRKTAVPRWFLIIVLMLTILTNGLIALTANLGGQIRHPEARSDFQLSK